MTTSLPPQPVLIVGTGLVGTSVGLALRAAGVRAHLRDVDQAAVVVAASLGAGEVGALEDTGLTEHGEPVRLVVVAVPPGIVARVVAEALSAHPEAVVTDVGSVKAEPLRVLAGMVGPEVLARYVGGHPMAGSEQSGPWAASGELFGGRAWAVTPHSGAAPAAIAAVESLARTCGAGVVTMSPDEHDVAVARVSHLPHLLSVLTAAQLVDAPTGHLTLSGQGLRDVTRVAAGDPALWSQILAANAPALRTLLHGVRDDLDALLAGLDGPGPGGSAAGSRGERPCRCRAEPGRRRHPPDPREARRPRPRRGRRGGQRARPPGGAGPALRRCGRLGRQRRGRADRPRPRPTRRPGRARRADRRGRPPRRGAQHSWLVGPPLSLDVRTIPTRSPPVTHQPDASRLVVAVDGPSGSGKSSTARGVARALGLRYLDTGAMYRALTWALLQRGVDVDDPRQVAAAAADVDLVSGTDPDAPTITADGQDVSVPIRGQEVTAAVSAVSAVPEVRAQLLVMQRSIVGAGGIVVEGRDIGSVVVPDAPVKVFLTAAADARARRRTEQDGGTDAALELTAADLERRDRLDSGRTASPLVQAVDAVVLDSTRLTLEQAVEEVVTLARRALAGTG